MFYNPYAGVTWNGDNRVRCNFHTHAGSRPQDSCGKLPLREVADCFADCGYDAIAVTNHDATTQLEGMSSDNLLLLPGYEYSADEAHMLCILADEVVQGSCDEAIASCRKSNGFVILCHPHWIHEEYWSFARMRDLADYTGLEIYNGVIEHLSGRGLATDRWDELLSCGRRVWGFANDDFHRWYDMARGWNMLCCTPTVEGIRDAVASGSFYASTGLLLTALKLEDGYLTVHATHQNGFCEPMQYRFIGNGGRLLHEVVGNSAMAELPTDSSYLRVEITAPNGFMLWTQPIFLD